MADNTYLMTYNEPAAIPQPLIAKRRLSAQVPKRKPIPRRQSTSALETNPVQTEKAELPKEPQLERIPRVSVIEKRSSLQTEKARLPKEEYQPEWIPRAPAIEKRSSLQTEKIWLPKEPQLERIPRVSVIETRSSLQTEETGLPNEEYQAERIPRVPVIEKQSYLQSPTTTLPSSYPHLDKPIVIPGLCVHDKTYHPIGIPFVRAYAQCLSKYGIDQAQFLHFIDHLNIMLRGHTQSFGNVKKAGSAVKAIGALDPTQITKLVGASIVVGAQAGAWLAIEGPMSRKRSYLGTANKAIFNPRNLHATVIDTSKLKKMLNLENNYVLMAPLDVKWESLSKAELTKGQRLNIRTPHRIMMTLKDRVEDITLMPEANPITAAHHLPRGVAIDEEERKLFASKNAADIRRLQIGAEITNELARSEALNLLRTAESMPAWTKQESKAKAKMYKKAREKDREMHATKKMKWLIINNLNPT